MGTRDEERETKTIEVMYRAELGNEEDVAEREREEEVTPFWSLSSGKNPRSTYTQAVTISPSFNSLQEHNGIG